MELQRPATIAFRINNFNSLKDFFFGFIIRCPACEREEGKNVQKKMSRKNTREKKTFSEHKSTVNDNNLFRPIAKGNENSYSRSLLNVLAHRLDQQKQFFFLLFFCCFVFGWFVSVWSHQNDCDQIVDHPMKNAFCTIVQEQDELCFYILLWLVTLLFERNDRRNKIIAIQFHWVITIEN